MKLQHRLAPLLPRIITPLKKIHQSLIVPPHPSPVISVPAHPIPSVSSQPLPSSSSSFLPNLPVPPPSKPVVFLGLDVSLRSTGIAVINTAGQLIYTSLIQLPTGTSPLVAGKEITTIITQLIQRYTIQATVIEDVPLNFGENLSSSLTRFILTRISGIVAYEIWRSTNYQSLVSLHYPNTVRSYFQLSPSSSTKQILPDESKQGRSKRLRKIAKDQVIRFIMLNFPSFNSPNGTIPCLSADPPLVAPVNSTTTSGTLEKGKKSRKKSTKTTTTTYTDAQSDIADATLVAMYAYVHYMEWSILKQDYYSSSSSLFKELMVTMVPSMRIGHSVIPPPIIPIVIEEIQKVHAQSILKEGQLYHDLSIPPRTESAASSSSSSNELSAVSKPVKKRKTRKEATATESTNSTTEVTLESNPRVYLQQHTDIIERIYDRLRNQYSNLCRDILLKEILPWKYLQCESSTIDSM